MGDLSDCNTEYNKLGGKNPISAGFEGFGQGLSGMIGLGGFWKPVDDTALSNMNTLLQNEEKRWDDIINAKEGTYSNLMTQIARDQQNVINTTVTLHEEIMDEKIATNTLMIQIIWAVLFVIIIYLLIAK